MNSTYNEIKNILENVRNQVYRNINSTMVRAYWEIGRIIVEEEQKGKKRAEYGKKLIEYLSKRLTSEYGKGFNESNLRRVRQFYSLFPIRAAVRHELSWTHYKQVLKLESLNAIKFYILETINNNWSTRELERQINSLLYERIILSRNKKRQTVSAKLSKGHDILLLLCLILTSCSNQQLLSEQTIKTQTYFCPKDNCTQILTSFLNSSNTSIHCALFDLKLKEVIDILSEKSKSIEVKLVIDNNNYKKQLKGPGIIKDTSSQLSHNKFCIVDNKKISTGSFNPTENGAYKNNNNLLIIHSKLLSNNYEQEFQELWNRSFGKGNTTKTPIINLNNHKYKSYFCPEDKCANKLRSEIKKAKYSIYFMVFSFTDKNVANQLIIKHNQGLDIKGILEKRQNSKYNVINLLKHQNINVRWDSNPNMLHHKVFIIDNTTIITGSFNPTNNANKNNDENLLIIEDRDIARLFLDEFNKLISIDNIN